MYKRQKLDDSVKSSTDESNAAELLAEHPAMVKRPVLVTGKKSLIGFSVDDYTSVLEL